MDLTLERPSETASRVTIGRHDGYQTPARLRLLGFDSCEFESHVAFIPGEQVSISIYRMGSIRARITSCGANVVEAEFDKHCPV